MNNNDSIRISVGGDTVFVNKDDKKEALVIHNLKNG